MTVNVGDTVSWTNQGPTGTRPPPRAEFDTGIMDAGQSGSHTFDTAGTFSYICTPHPNMKGTVIVQAAEHRLAATAAGGDGHLGHRRLRHRPARRRRRALAAQSTGMDALALGLLGLLMLRLGVGVRRRSAAEAPQPAGRIGW